MGSFRVRLEKVAKIVGDAMRQRKREREMRELSQPPVNNQVLAEATGLAFELLGPSRFYAHLLRSGVSEPFAQELTAIGVRGMSVEQRAAEHERCVLEFSPTGTALLTEDCYGQEENGNGRVHGGDGDGRA
jgi:hypothetical protein